MRDNNKPSKVGCKNCSNTLTGIIPCKDCKKLGYKGPKYRVLGKKKGETSHKMEEVWTFNPYRKGKK